MRVPRQAIASVAGLAPVVEVVVVGEGDSGLVGNRRPRVHHHVVRRQHLGVGPLVLDDVDDQTQRLLGDGVVGEQPGLPTLVVVGRGVDAIVDVRILVLAAELAERRAARIAELVGEQAVVRRFHQERVEPGACHQATDGRAQLGVAAAGDRGFFRCARRAAGEEQRRLAQQLRGVEIGDAGVEVRPRTRARRRRIVEALDQLDEVRVERAVGGHAEPLAAAMALAERFAQQQVGAVLTVGDGSEVCEHSEIVLEIAGGVGGPKNVIRGLRNAARIVAADAVGEDRSPDLRKEEVEVGDAWTCQRDLLSDGGFQCAQRIGGADRSVTVDIAIFIVAADQSDRTAQNAESIGGAHAAVPVEVAASRERAAGHRGHGEPQRENDQTTRAAAKESG